MLSSTAEKCAIVSDHGNASLMLATIASNSVAITEPQCESLNLYISASLIREAYCRRLDDLSNPQSAHITSFYRFVILSIAISASSGSSFYLS